MQTTSFIRVALLALVAASVGVWAYRSWRTPPESAAAAVSPLPKDGVAVVNFHGAVRCPTCRSIGALSRATVEQDFADEVRAGALVWTEVDFDADEHLHFKDDYDLVSSNVVVVRRAAGRDERWARLDDVWSLYSDEPAFRDYLGAAIRESLGATKP